MPEFNLNKILQILEDAAASGISISFEKEELLVRFQKGKQVDKGFLEKLKLNKPFLIHYFKTYASHLNTTGDTNIKKIDRTNLSSFPLSYAQERLWFIDQLEGSVQYHIPTVLQITGPIDAEALSNAIHQIVDRHEVLRTVIKEKDGKPTQYVNEAGGWQLNVEDGSEYVDNDELLKQRIQYLISQPFNLATDYMIKACLIRISQHNHVLVVTLHHIASDGWSVSIIVKELVHFYQAFKAGIPIELPPLHVQYADFATWQQQYLAGMVLASKLAYWKNKLKDVETLQLKGDFERPAIQSTRGAAISFHIDKEVNGQLAQICQQQGATMFMTLLAAFNVLLSRYTGQQDICIGMPMAGRDQQEAESLIGFFVNSLALRNDLSENLSFTDFLTQVRTTTLEAYDHKELPFEKIVEATVTERSLSRSPIFQVIIALQNLPPVPELRLGDVSLSLINFESHTSKFDLALIITETDNGLHCNIRYCTDIFKEATALQIADHFKNLLTVFAKNPAQRIHNAAMLSLQEEQQLLITFNQNKAHYPAEKSIIDLFEERVLAQTSGIAVAFKNDALSYQQLNERSNQLARFLQAKGIAVGALVAIGMERCTELLVSIMGVLKAGAAYLPLDTAYPPARLEFMLKDTGVTMVLAKSSTIHLIPSSNELTIVCIDIELENINKFSNINLNVAIQPSDKAYVIYTSGSTGTPKGVVIPHCGVVNLALSQASALHLTPQTATLQFASAGFDASCYEIFNTLLSGGKLVLPEKNDLLSAESFEECVYKHQVDLAVLPPSFLQVIKNNTATIKTIVSAGEALPVMLAKQIQAKGIRLINAYGPTENTVCTTLTDEPLLNDGTIVIGKPVYNVQVLILDAAKNIVPLGAAGELCIGGPQLSQGYLNRTELTKEKFIVNPFPQTGSKHLYKSGDLARWLPDGNIEYLGRIDDQVKLRGYRIELGEIENCILQSGLATQAVVLLKTDEHGTKRLAAYVVVAGDFDKVKMQAFLQDKLPEYMVPPIWITLNEMPLTTNGKIDKKALPLPDATAIIKNNYTAPSNEIEEQLVGVWQELLHKEQVGIHDNFFELGGDSILTIQVVSRCRRLGFNLLPRDLFIHQTIGRLANAIADNTSSSVMGEQGTLTGNAGLLPIQQWYLNSNPTAVSYFNQGVLLGLDKTITAEWLQQAFDQLMIHHDALRFSYSLNESRQWKQVYGVGKIQIASEDLRQVAQQDLANAITTKATACQSGLEITTGKIIEVLFIQTPDFETNNRLLIIIHHLVVDGVSWRILLNDLELLLKNFIDKTAYSLEQKGSSYRQWYLALEQYGQSMAATAQLPYWQQAAKKYHPLPVDKEFAGVVKDKDTARHTVRLNALQTSALLQQVPRVYHTEINDLLLAALAATINECMATADINIGLEGHGREDIDTGVDITRAVGWFTNLYPLYLSLSNISSHDALIKTVKEQLRQLPGKGLAYGVLKYINKQASLQGPQPWDIIFNYLGQLDGVVRESKIFSGASESQGPGRSTEQEVTEKISVNSSVRGGELIVSWTYSTLHYHTATVEHLATTYLLKLNQLITHCVEQERVAGVIFTPSDYGLGVEISYTELDRFLDVSADGITRRQQISGIYRLSGLQQGMLFHGLYDSRVAAYIEQFGCDMEDVDIAVFTKSWNHLIQRHTILRSAFYVDTFKIPVQCVYTTVDLPILLLDYRTFTPDEQDAAIQAYYLADKIKGIDFTQAPLMRLAIFQLTDKRFKMLWTSHHILFDGWSFPILMEEFLTTYELLSEGTKLPQQEEDRFEDYIRYIERSDKDAEEKYWRNYLKNIEQPTLLPFIPTTIDRNKGKGQYKASNIHLAKEVAAKIQQFAHSQRVTVNTIMQCVWAYLLHRYTGSKKIVYGIIVSGRPDDLAGVENRVGMFINTLPLFSTLDENLSITEWLQGMQADQVNSRQYQHTPFTVVQGWSGISGDLFDTLLTFENYPFNKVITKKKWALNVGNIDVQDHTNYPLSIIIGSAEQINIRFSYNTLLLSDQYVENIKGHFEHVLMQLVQKGDQAINSLSLLTPAEYQQQQQFNEADEIVANSETLISLFKQQVASTPDALALIFEETEMTYRQLNEASNRLALLLQSNGVATGSLVPICTNRSADMLVGILGIMKAGGAYVPIDPEYPQERIQFILNDTAAKIVLTNEQHINYLPTGLGTNAILISQSNTYKNDEVLLPVPVQPDQLAYIIYTSGSTGKPKGVMVEHGNLVSYLVNKKLNYINKETSHTGSFIHLSYTFDASITAMFMPLINGKAVVIGSKQSIDIFEDDNLLKYAPYDFIKITPAHLELIHPAFKKFKNGLLTEKLVIGGEALHAGLFDSFIHDGINATIINEYGPTETTVGCTTFTFKILSAGVAGSTIPIGKPVHQASIYITDDQLRLLPAGVKGELCIGGIGVTRGYLNRPDLTQEKFVVNLFNKTHVNRIYKTGDIARWLPDGNIEFFGRTDDQVKIRGYRIELGEIEQVLQQQPSVVQGVVLVKPDKEAGKRLASYYVPGLAAVKLKEAELQFQRVATWKELYEVEYGQTEQDENIDPEFNIVGWNDSFTGGAIAAEQMKSWLDDIVSDVLAENPQNVLEVGCGTGLIYYRLAGKLNKYIGCDLSKSSINQIKHHIRKGTRAYGDTELFTAPAHEVGLSGGQQVDTILLNSMVQYFPGVTYMDAVIEKCMNLLGVKGRIIIGDVRDNRLLELFKGRLRLQKLQDSVTLKEFIWGIDQDTLKEEELCFSPRYFYQLKDSYPLITHIDVQWKQGDYINELSLYRYTVIIYVGIIKETLEPNWQNWDSLADKQDIFLHNDKGTLPSLIAIKDVPNPRLYKEKLLQQALQNSNIKTVGEIAGLLSSEDDDDGKAVALILKKATQYGYHTRLLIHEDPLKVNLLLQANPSNQYYIHQPAAKKIYSGGGDAANIPLFTDISFLLQQDIKAAMGHTLPDYMLPVEWNALSRLPLTVNGKVDRIFLSQREERVFINTLNYLPPVTDTEKVLAEIWKDLLHLEKVGIEDDFFMLGGHSLLAMRVIASIRKQLQVEISIKHLFLYPTIGSLATHIQQQGRGILLPPVQPINPRPGDVPLSFGQERLWFIDQLDGSLQYHIPAIIQLKGDLDKDALSFALKQIIDRHQVLRTIINPKDGQGYQILKEAGGWQMEKVNRASLNNDVLELNSLIKSLINIPFNLQQDYMLRATLIELDANEHILLAVLHHIVSDGWSTSILVNELAEGYNAKVENRPAVLKTLPVQYADFAIWQRTYLQGEVWNKKLDYWAQKLEGVAALQLPNDLPRPLMQSTNGSVIVSAIDKVLADQLQQFSQSSGATLFMTLLATLNALLYRYTGQDSFCVGTPIAGRQQQEVEGLIGFFINTLALRSDVDGEQSFHQLLQQVKATTLEAYEHQEVPFEKIVELVVRERDMSRTPLFQVMLVLQNTPEVQDLQLGQLQLSRMSGSGHSTSRFELTFALTETTRGLNFSIEYCTDLFTVQFIERMANHFKNMLQAVVATPHQSIGRLPMLNEAEVQHLLVEMNNTYTSFDENATLPLLFARQVLSNPLAIAITENNTSITYGELNINAIALAAYLVTKGVKSEILVPIVMNRSILMITAMLAVMKAGGAYIPIDPEYPVERIAYMVADSQATLIITNLPVEGIPKNTNIEIINPAEIIDLILLKPQPFFDENIAIHQLAYVVYTSGSTGRPKGVMITHQGLGNLVQWHNKAFDVSNNSKATTMAGVGFDAFAWEVWPYLASGATLHVINDQTRLSPPALLDYCFAKKITHSFIATALVHDFIAISRAKSIDLKYLLTGGDKLGPVDVNGLAYQFVNNYGPTENTVVTTSYVLNKKHGHLAPPIGQPIANTVIYILNDQHQLAPKGIAGELCIGGRGIARGYLNLPELSLEKFTANPFDTLKNKILYKSGDIVRWLPCGNIEYLGRRDEQMKIRGYRIEAGEIERLLLDSGDIEKALIRAVTSIDGNKKLVGYVISSGNFGREKIVGFLRKKIPEYMIPALWVQLDSFPVTRNGKIDYNALPQPVTSDLLSREYMAPVTLLEQQLVAVWEELLNVERIGVNDDFFEMGGHSLLAMRLVARIETSLMVTIPIKVLFQFTTISGLSKYLEIQGKKEEAVENITSYKIFDV